MTIEIPPFPKLINDIKNCSELDSHTKEVAINELKRINKEFKHTDSVWLPSNLHIKCINKKYSSCRHV